MGFCLRGGPLADLYCNAGVWYAPRWRNPRTGTKVPAHSLKTRDRALAESAWTLERAAILQDTDIGRAPVAACPPQGQSSGGGFSFMARPGETEGGQGKAKTHPTTRPGLLLSELFHAYLETKIHDIAPDTLHGYKNHASRIVEQIGDRPVGRVDGDVLALWVKSAVDDLGRTHTVKKRFEAIVKPSLRYAVAAGWLPRLPLLPKLRSDYRSVGARRAALTRDEFAALRAQLPEEIVIRERWRGGEPAVCFPRLYADLAVSTGLHAADLQRFAGRDFDATRSIWHRRNTKGMQSYRDEWFPCDPYLLDRLQEAVNGRGVAGEVRFCSTGNPHELWAHHQLRKASIACKLSTIVTAIDLRRTFATWRRDDGWTFGEVARVLGNSTGMVQEVYAQLPAATMVRAFERVAPSSQNLLKITAILDGERRGPRSAIPPKTRSIHRSKGNP